MRIAFHAPMKPPGHPHPSGDRRMGRLICAAVEAAGHRPVLASDFRSYEAAGDADRQATIEHAAADEAARLVRAWRDGPEARPDAWLTYHLYHKAPDLLGPPVVAALGMPYLIVEASFARKQRSGPHARWLGVTAQAIARADAILSITPEDEEGVAPLVGAPDRLHRLPPFLDPAPFENQDRDALRRALADALPSLDPERPWLLAVAMMRPGDKLASYRMLGRSLGMIADPPWQLLVVGDGSARPHVEEALAAIGPPAAVFAGAREEAALVGIYAACDLFVWPAYNEAYGMAMLEAQAAGLPVVAGEWRGVPEVVANGETGVLTAANDMVAFAQAVVDLMGDPSSRARMGRAASERVRARHSIDAAAAVLGAAVDRACRARAGRP